MTAKFLCFCSSRTITYNITKQLKTHLVSILFFTCTVCVSSSLCHTYLHFATGGYRWMITPEMLQQTPGVWYVDTRLFNSTWEPGLTLTFTSFMSKCLYWHTGRETWTTDGCQVSFHLDKVRSTWLYCFLLCMSRDILVAAFAYQTVTCCRCPRWEREALQGLHTVSATTSLCLGAPSLWCQTTWTYLVRQSCSPPFLRTMWCSPCCVLSLASTWSRCCGPAMPTAGHALRSVYPHCNSQYFCAFIYIYIDMYIYIYIKYYYYP